MLCRRWRHRWKTGQSCHQKILTKADQQPSFFAVGFFKPHYPNAPKKYDSTIAIRLFWLKFSQVADNHPPLALHSHHELADTKMFPKMNLLSNKPNLRHGYACVLWMHKLARYWCTKRHTYMNTIVVTKTTIRLEKAVDGKGTNFEIDTGSFLIRTFELSNQVLPLIPWLRYDSSNPTSLEYLNENWMPKPHADSS